MTLAVETLNLTKKFRQEISFKDIRRMARGMEKIAVDSMTVRISQGEIFGLLGPNGSGKTTFLKMLSTTLRPSSGSASVFGHDVIRDEYKVRQTLGLVTGDERSHYWRLTGRQNLSFFASLYGLTRDRLKRQVAEVIELVDLVGLADVRVDQYSTGMKKRLAIARGLLSSPKIILLDEPTMGLDPIAAQNLLQMIRRRIIDYYGSTVILTTHILREAEQLCNRIAILSQGRLVACGTIPELKLGLRQCDNYSIKVKSPPAGCLRRLNQLDGVIDCVPHSLGDNVVHLQLKLSKNDSTLSEVLKYILHSQADIVSCTTEEISFDEVFHSLLQQTGVPSGPRI